MTSASPSSRRVLLADDHVVFRQGLRAVLEQEGFTVVGEVSDGRAAVRMCESARPDVALLDVAMPLLNGVDAAREIGALSLSTRVILLTMYAEDSYVLASLRAGVAGYVLKTSAASDVIQAIDAVSRGEIYLSPGVSRTAASRCAARQPNHRPASTR